MDFSKAISKAYETKWSYINTFTVHMYFEPKIAEFIGWSQSDETDINLNIISINTPQLTNSPVEMYVGDRWKIHNGRDELYKFSITFRDQNQLDLYKKFTKAYFYQKTHYFDDIKMTISLYKDADYVDEVSSKIYSFEETMIDSISQIDFNNTTEAQIAEFTVEFKCAYPLIDVQF